MDGGEVQNVDWVLVGLLVTSVKSPRVSLFLD